MRIIWLMSFFSLGRTLSQDESSAAGMHWVSTWTAASRDVGGTNLPPSPYGGSSVTVQFKNTTIRQTFRSSIGAGRIKFKLSNQFSKQPLPITAASIALPKDGATGTADIQSLSAKELTFAGAASVVLAPGEIIYSDAIEFNLRPLSTIALSLYLRDGQSGTVLTGHPGSRTTTWLQTGNAVNATSVAEQSMIGWFFAAQIEGWVTGDHRGLVALGDSITDGLGSETNKNNRWTDVLAERLQQTGMTSLAVNNQGIGGNAVVQGGLGQTLLKRFQRDGVSQSGAKYLLIFEGVNDLGYSGLDAASQEQMFENLTRAYTDLVFQARAAGLITIGATITPFGGSGYAHPLREATRVRINDWILKHSTYDHTVDFSAMVGNGSDKLLPEYSSDGLHLSVAGYKQMGERFPLEILQ
ncbi:hypothetical protein CORC01_11695 [Colletotrichum orchidophilum]|uniref:SGNH hydrolase-type esterase domain-containing protein n=1 Tax=Colletotrichum orchidophilum TaxID=1209926 RepID=A0A1G4AV90_9PEZI|nr:uncharacterized protein CORC01_11695 [Colletotrichum orchidophilum]OHE92972.1 hypothetical protein CORC01_11695 [Colletotrichum orchidophilum]